MNLGNRLISVRTNVKLAVPRIFALRLMQLASQTDILHTDLTSAISHSLQLWLSEQLYTRLVFVFPEYTPLYAHRHSVQLQLDQLSSEVKVWSLESVKWLRSPSRRIVLIGSLYQLISSLLNRSFTVDRSFQPMVAGLLSNDSQIICLQSSRYGWAGKTLAELEGLMQPHVHRHRLTWHFESVPSPATLQNRIQTRSYPIADLSIQSIQSIDESTYHLIPSTFLKDKNQAYFDNLHRLILNQHRTGSQTLVVVNQVEQAQRLYQALAQSIDSVYLYHGCYRGYERQQIQQSLLNQYRSTGGILIADQAIESNRDLMAQTVITELCPWASWKTRIDRGTAVNVIWIGMASSQNSLCTPYDPLDIAYTTQVLSSLPTERTLTDLHQIDEPPVFAEGLLPTHTLLRRLFDTDPFGDGERDTDINLLLSPYPDVDVYVLWRDFNDPTAFNPCQPTLTETCPIHKFVVREFVQRKQVFRYGRGEWHLVAPNAIRAGDILMLDAHNGGYDAKIGFTRGKDTPPPVHSDKGTPPLPYRRTSATIEGMYTATIAQWTAQALHHLNQLSEALPLDIPWSELRTAICFCLSGRATAEFQQLLGEDSTVPFANRNAFIQSLPDPDLHRSGYRYELASLLYSISQNAAPLASYLILSHAGRLRCQVAPTERDIEASSQLHVAQCQGVRAGDQVYDTEIDPSILLAGQLGSWTEALSTLLNQFAPHQLLFFEALIRAIYWQTCNELKEVAPDDDLF